MLKRTLKMLSGLVSICRGKGAAAPRARAVGNSDLNDLLERIRRANPPTDREALAPDYDDREPARADYRVCDTCDAFLSGRESTSFTCRRCADARRVRFGPQPARASVAVGGVVLSLPLGRHAPPGGRAPRTLVRLGTGQAEALARILLKPGSDGMGIGFDRNDSMLVARWRPRGDGQEAELAVCETGSGDETMTLSAAQAARLGEAVAGCLRIIFAVARTCDHDFADARNERVASGEVCLKCGAIRAGNRD